MEHVPDCDYCGRSFDAEDAYLEHLAEEHYEDLGRIDRRRVDSAFADSDETSQQTVLVAAAAVLGLLIILGGAFLLFGGGGGGGDTDLGSSAKPTPHDYRSVHYHGTLVMRVGGDRVDFSQDKYQVQNRYFHFENRNGTQWHVHAKDVTLQYAMDTLDIHVTNSTVEYQGTVYRDSAANTDVTVTVNGNSVKPSSYVLQPGDRVRIIVETGG